MVFEVQCDARKRKKHERRAKWRRIDEFAKVFVPVFETLEDFCFGKFKAYQNIRKLYY